MKRAILMVLLCIIGCNRSPTPKGTLVEDELHSSVVEAPLIEGPEIDPIVTEAWKKAGARYTRFYRDDSGAAGNFGLVTKPSEVVVLRAFSFFDAVEPHVIAKLPRPATPFALMLGDETKLSDELLLELAAFDNLRALELGTSISTRIEVRDFGILKNLQFLALHGYKVTDAVLQGIADLKVLRGIDLNRAAVTDAGLGVLVSLPELKYLGLGSTKVTDAGMRAVALLRGLHFLGISNTKITDVGLKELIALENLRGLMLENTKLTDEGFKGVARLMSLQTTAVNIIT